MAIYFIHVISSLLGFTILSALFNKNKNIFDVFLPSIFGVSIGILVFKFAKYSLLDTEFKIFFDFVAIIFLLISILWLFFEFKLAKRVTFLILGVCYGATYGSVSMLFPLFDGELLDTISIISFFLLCFAMFLLVILFFVISNLKTSLKPCMLKILIAIIIIALVIDKGANIILEFMRLGTIPTYSYLLSLVAKGIYLATFLAYFYIGIVFLLSILYFLSRPKLLPKSEIGLISYRFLIAKRNFISTNVKIATIVVLSTLSFLLYFDLYASRPPKISDPILVEPKGDKFIFDAEILRDNKLHRYAYITDEGKEVRFFLINRFSDKLSPVIVFDSCMICGDMGYVKKNNELICISCNVRIFLPSVGKEGGCNPIPMPFKFDGKNIIVDFDTILNGSKYFSKVVEKMVLDPVSRKLVSNITSRSYLYYNRTYFFENNQTQAEFEANPEKYVDKNGTLK